MVKKKDPQYWKNIAKKEKSWQLEQLKNDKFISDRIALYYTDALNRIQQDIDKFKKTTVTRVSINDFDIIVRDIDVLIQTSNNVWGKLVAKRSRHLLRVYNATARLGQQELLQSIVGAELVKMGVQIDDKVSQTLTQAARDEYTRQAGIFAQTVDPDLITDKRIYKDIAERVNGYNYSERVWQDVSVLKSKLDVVIGSNFITGLDNQAASRRLRQELSKYFDVSKRNADRIVRTETARVQFNIQKGSIKGNGYKYAQYIAEIGACDICSGLADGDDGHGRGVYTIDDVPDIPQHPYCRCSVSAYWVD